MLPSSVLLVALIAFAQGGQGANARPGSVPPCPPNQEALPDAPVCLVARAEPEYSDKARQANVQGEVLLQVMVKPDGTVGQVLIEKSLDTRFGLDQRAI